VIYRYMYVVKDLVRILTYRHTLIRIHTGDKP